MSEVTKVVGGCLCSAIRYSVAAEPLAAAACHCRDCQYVSGGAEANVLIVPTAALQVEGAVPTRHVSTAASGGTVWRAFCPTCGTPLFSGNAARPEFTAIKAGSLDDPAAFRRKLHVWTASAPPWHLMEPDLPKLPGNPPG